MHYTITGNHMTNVIFHSVIGDVAQQKKNVKVSKSYQIVSVFAL